MQQANSRQGVDTPITNAWMVRSADGRVVAGEKPFVAEASVDVSAGAQWRKLRVQGTRSGVGPNGSALTATREGWMFFPPQSESLTYDLDGNLTADAR
jgi:hypothetical protein